MLTNEEWTAVPEGALLGQEILDCPQRDGLGGDLDAVGHRLPLMAEGVY